MRVRAVLVTAAVLLGGSLTGCAEDEPADEIVVGEAFTYDGFEVADGWTMEKVERSVAMQDVVLAEVRGEITNEGEEPRAPIFELVFAHEGERVSTIRCSAPELDPGETGDLLCPGLSSVYPEDYDTIVAQPITR